MALHKYLRSFAILYCNHANFFCGDDKHAVNVGDPDVPLASLMRQKKAMVLCGHDPDASDHDWHRFKLYPSVLCNVNIPEDIKGSFYDSMVTVTLKNSMFQKSTPLRHQAEKEVAVATWNPIECSFSDGGPDHNPQNYSVKIGQLASWHIFLRLTLTSV